MTEEEKLSKKLILVFEYFVSKITNIESFALNPNERERTSIKNFSTFLLKKYHNTLGINWFISYFSFQLNYWSDKSTRQGKDGIPKIEWVLGSKAFERWLGKSSLSNYFIKENIIYRYKINSLELEKILNIEKNVYSKEEIFSYLESQRKELLNTDRGVLNCLYLKIFYSEESTICQICNYKKRCQQRKIK